MKRARGHLAVLIAGRAMALATATASAATPGLTSSDATAPPATTAAALPVVDMEATGLAANGLPGTTSLTTLGQNRYTVTHEIGPGVRVQRDGYVVDARTQAMLTEAERLLGFGLVLQQGSYNPGGDPSSAGTHDGGGVVDVDVTGMSAATRTTVAGALRQVGFAAWVRDPSQGDWPWHIHAAAINDTDLSSQAQNQTGDYYLGLNGLADRGPDDGPRIPIQTWEEYQRTH